MIPVNVELLVLCYPNNGETLRGDIREREGSERLHKSVVAFFSKLAISVLWSTMLATTVVTSVAILVFAI